MTQNKILRQLSRIVRSTALCISAILLFVGFYKPEKKLPIFPAMAHDPRIYIGQGEGLTQGQGEVFWVGENNQQYTCSIIKKAPGMVCGFDILFYKKSLDQREENTAKGRFSDYQLIDLSAYDGLRIHAEYVGEKKMKNITVFLRSTAKDIDKLKILNEEKIHSIYIPSRQLTKPISIDFNNFKIADWWVSKYNKSINETDLDLRHLIQIGFAVSGVSPIGKHQIKISRIDAYGYWISMENVYLIIILIWVSFLLLEFFIRFIYLSYQHNTSQVSLELLQKRYEDAKNASYLDPLTSMYNRRGLGNIMDAIEKTNQSKNLGLLILDIDFFKKINDVYGHTYGDIVLAETASVLKSNIRNADIIARWGGEEFIILFDCDSHDTIKIYAEKLRLAIENAQILDSEGKRIQITISIGMSLFQTDEAFNAAFNRADEALYEAKNNGRNRCYLIK